MMSLKSRANGPDLGRRTSGSGRRRLFAWLLLFSVLLLAGCGGAGTAGSAGGGATVAPGPAPAGGPPAPPALETGQGRLSFSKGEARAALPLASPSEATDPQSAGNLPLKSGWNLVSFPVAQVTRVTLDEGIHESAFAWDPANKGYQRVDLTNPASISAEPGTARGFWVYARQDSKITWQGWENSGARARNELSLGQGWNLVGYPYEQICRFSEVKVKSTGEWSALPASVSPTPGPGQLLYHLGYTWVPGDQSGYRSAQLSAGTESFGVGAGMWVYVPEGPVSLRYPAVTAGSGFEVTVEQVQAAVGNDWTAAETYVTTELSATQARKLCGLLDPPGAESLGRFRKFQPLEGVTLPTRFSWTTKEGRDWLSPVKNQGPYGTCLAFASVAAFEGLLEIANPGWAQDFDLSESYFWHKATDGRAPSPGGMNFEEAAAQATVGTDDETVSPYSQVGSFQNPPGDTFLHSVAEVTSVFGREAMKQALLKGPLVGGMPVYSDFFNYAGGIYRYRLGYFEGYHAILIVGWDDATGSWLCKNSWSTDWGEEGLFRIAYGEIWDEALAFADVKPLEKRLVSLEVDPGGVVQLPEGRSLQFRALGHYGDGSSAYLANGVTWTTSNPAVAGFSDGQPGWVVAHKVGQTGVTATYAGIVSTSVTLKVTEPVPTPSPSPVPLAAGYDHSLWVWGDGTVIASGNNEYGQLGYVTTEDPWQVGIRQTVSGLSDVVAVAGGGAHSLALKNDGTVCACGKNEYGQLGYGTTVDWLQMRPVLGLSDVVAVAGGGSHSLALKGDGTVWAWGGNWQGQLGDGTTWDRRTPVQVSGLSDVVAVAGGASHSLALKGDGTVWAWGWNDHGQLGDGTTDHRDTPVQVSGLSDVVAVAGGACHSLALKGDGTVWAWGWNGHGQLGDGTTWDRRTPVQVSGLSDVVAVDGGYIHSLALKGDGTVWAWGGNWHGQLGDGTTWARRTPVPVLGLSDVVAVAVGYEHCMARTGNGEWWTWGHNNFGQLGFGRIEDQHAPLCVFRGLVGIQVDPAEAPVGGQPWELPGPGTLRRWLVGGLDAGRDLEDGYLGRGRVQ